MDRLMKQNRIIGQREWKMISLIFFIKLLSVSSGSTTFKQGKILSAKAQRELKTYENIYLDQTVQINLKENTNFVLLMYLET